MKPAIKRLLKFVYYLPGTAYNTLNFRLKGVRSGRGLETVGRIFVRNKGTVVIGENVRINSSGKANPIGAGDRTYLQILRGGKLAIGDGTRMSNCAITSAKSVSIGRNVRIGAGCKIYDTDFHSLNPYLRTRCSGADTDARCKDVVIEDYVFIGAGCFILKGARIGTASVIGAGSVVTGSVPSDEIWAGNPARFVRKLSESERSRR